MNNIRRQGNSGHSCICQCIRKCMSVCSVHTIVGMVYNSSGTCEFCKVVLHMSVCMLAVCCMLGCVSIATIINRKVTF